MLRLGETDMATSRRDFLKTTAIATAGVAFDGIHGLAEDAAAATADPAAAQVAAAPTAAIAYTRGIGRYPGNPAENFDPTVVLAAPAYRNLALMRPAYHSSSYDYNLTAQLVTDGIKDTQLPRWVAVSDSVHGLLPRPEREAILDHNATSALELVGAHVGVDIFLGGGAVPLEIDALELLVVGPKNLPAAAITLAISTSEDGRTWQKSGNVTAPRLASTAGLPPDLINSGLVYSAPVSFPAATNRRYYRVELFASATAGITAAQAAQTYWRLSEVAFLRAGARVQVGGPYSFTSAWMSAGAGEEWVYVDLGSRFSFDRVKLHWIARAAEGSLQVSDNAETWRDLVALKNAPDAVDDIQLAAPARGRYVRVLMTKPTLPQGYILSELEVFGHGGFMARPAVRPRPAQGRVPLAGGNWRLQRANFVSQPGEALARAGFNDASWLVATVPGTVLSSYVNAGAIPDPNFGQNQLHISDSYFYSDFWYRTEFTVPALAPGQSALLRFDGINWKAEVYLNGEKLGRIEGGFQRGLFDITAKLQPGRPNALAVRIEKNATPGSCKQKTLENVGKNGGALGADNPTFHASIGWDWIPTIRGRNTGIWGNVFLELTQQVTLENPFVSTRLPLPATSSADVTLSVDLVNRQPKPFAGLLRVRFGDARFEQRVQLNAGEMRTLTLDSSTIPALHIKNPKLWWPVGYGEPNLYAVDLNLSSGDRLVATRSFQAGLRQMTYSEDGGILKIWINGRRFIARGGNWGFSESMLRYRAREYDAAVRYHREMNFTMIRNWVGQIGDEALYEACDRHGVMVWHDFWLANPWDGPEPDDNALFLANVRDFILRIRNHASIGIYCGRNEGFPPAPLESGIRKILAELHPGLHYIPSSADEVVSGHGPYQAMPLESYFETADVRLHSEVGAPNIPPIESVRLMMPERALWPQGLDWGLHDFCLNGAQGGDGFRAIIDKRYGGAASAEEWIRLAQHVNYETYRAIFEAQSRYRMGALLWMSHPCWPSFVWQTYDYFFEPTAAYFGCKKGSEPLHIQWNRLTDTIEVVNLSAGNITGLTAQLEILNLDGSTKATQSIALDSQEDSVLSCFKVNYPAGLTPVHFLRLTLTRDNRTVSSNFYLRGLDPNDLKAIRALPAPQLKQATAVEQHTGHWTLTTRLANAGKSPALMVRIKAVRSTTGDRILPAIYSDNYIALMPGETRILVTEVNEADARGERPAIVLAS